MNLYKNLPYHILGVFLFMLLKLSFKYADLKEITFLLYPTDKLINLLTGSTSVYLQHNGYYNNHLNILIDKSCAGFNFWILSFLMILFLFLKYTKSHLQKAGSIFMALLFGFLLTIMVNTSRIFVSVVSQDKLSSIFNLQTTVIHESIGIIINLSFLIITYLITEKFIIKYTNYAKLA